MERIPAWRQELNGTEDGARASTGTTTSNRSNIIDLTSDSSHDGNNSSPDSVRIISHRPPVQLQQQPPARSKAQPSLFLPRQPQQQPLRPLNQPTPAPIFASSSAAFGQPTANRLQGMPRIPKKQQQPRFEIDDDPSPAASSSSSASLFISQQPPPKFASSSKAFQVPNSNSNSNSARNSTSSSTSGLVGASQGGLNVKQRIALAMQEEAKSKGIAMGTPIAVPKNPVRSAQKQVAPSHSAPTDDPLAESSLPDLGLTDSLSQEAALAELLSTTLDLSSSTSLTSSAPPTLLCTLLPHQIQGLHWLEDREKGKKRGGILADDMGLGKTVQMLALVLKNGNPREGEGVVRMSNGKRCKTTLIICPVALMQQWKTEIETKSNAGLTVCIHHGTGKKTARQLAKYDIVLTSYNTAAAEWVDPKPKRGKKKGSAEGSEEEGEGSGQEGGSGEKKERGALFGVEKWYRIILDEAHSIKGRTTKAHKACCDLVGHYKWCLSGTPIQNSVLDLFALFEFLGKIVNPLHDYSEFKLKISDPLKNKRTKIAMTRLAVVLKAVMLRRTKGMMIDGKPLLSLPKREVIEVKGPFLDEDELAFYKAVEEKMTLTMNAFLKAGTAMSNYTSVLILLLRMRQACSHPSLITSSSAALDREALSPADPASLSASTPEEDDLSSLLSGLGSLSVAQARQCALCDQDAMKGEEEPYCRKCATSMQGLGGVKMSTKVRKMLDVLEGIRKEGKGRKTIVFSQFTSMFNVIEPFLKTAGYKFVRFDGKLNAVQKEAALNKIREDPETTIILISIKCGSVGLNLTVCSRVILLDLWWNPAIEAQAFDRAHRFGQKEDVKIYKITVDNTIEDRILTLQEEKAEIAKAALEGGDMTKANKLSMRDMLFLFRGDGEGVREGKSKGKGKARDDESD